MEEKQCKLNFGNRPKVMCSPHTTRTPAADTHSFFFITGDDSRFVLYSYVHYVYNRDRLSSLAVM